MYTGLVQTLGRVQKVSTNESGKEFVFYCPDLVQDIKIDDSIAINGVCLTATAVTETGFKAQAVHITLEKTNLGKLSVDQKVNVELSMKYSDRVGGHFVQGHVNGVATFLRRTTKGENNEVWFKAPAELQKYLLKEGSVALDGISLTIADVKDDEFLITFIPHTWTATQIHTRAPGDELNLEVDMMAKMMANYVEMYLNNKRENHA